MPRSKRDDPQNAVMSMCSDMGKHGETNTPALPTLSLMGIMEISNGADAVRRWIDGFN